MFKTFKEWLDGKAINKEAFESKTIEDQATLQKEYMSYVSETLKENGATKAQVEAIEKSLKDLPTKEAFEKMQKDLGEAMEGVNKILERTSGSGKMKDAAKYQLRKMVEENHADIIDAIKNRKEFDFTFKVAAMHMTNNGTVSNGALTLPLSDNYLMDEEIAVIRYPENFILNVISNRQATKVPEQSFKKGQVTTEGAVAVTAEGAVKPLMQYKFVRTATSRKKYAARIEWTEEFEMDFEALLAAIVRLFEADVIRAWQNGLITQITTDATAYASSVLDGTFPEPDNGLSVVAAQSVLQQLNYNADTVLMNPADLVSTLYIQNANGDLKTSPYINTTAGTIAGMRLFSSNTIPQGTAYVGDATVYNEIHSDYIFRTGQYGDQLIENEYTAIGEVFSIIEIAEQDLVAWVELNLNAVKTLLTKV